MPSGPRDPQDLRATFDTGATTHRTPAPGRSEPSQKPFSPHRLLPLSQTESFRRRSTTLHLPALDPSENFRKRSTTLRLPALDPSDFQTRETPPRIPALEQLGSAEEGHLQRAPATSDLWFIAGPNNPVVREPEKPKAPLSVKMRVRLALLFLTLLLLLSAQGYAAHLALDCTDAQAHQSRQNCLALSVFTALSDSAAVPPPAAPTATGPKIPAIPNDLPANIYNFMVLALPYAVQAHQALGWPTSVILAEWGLEHGWSVPDWTGYNWGNTTYAPGCPYQGSRFCYASTRAEGLREYIYTARLHYYDGVRAAVAGGADATALALGESPWDEGHYTTTGHPGSSLLTILRNFNLYRFDVDG